MDHGQAITIWTARIAAISYMFALLSIAQGFHKSARLFWTMGLLFYLVHVGLAFTYVYNWSHVVAYRETARQTTALFGVDWGGGLYLNYVFTALWFADCAWWWTAAGSYRSRPRWIAVAIHTFMAFMFLNATIVARLLR
jgi:hypothetical protein